MKKGEEEGEREEGEKEEREWRRQGGKEARKVLEGRCEGERR